ncbi:hypothetical protein OROMI_033954 [Orobanche minor]
MIEQCTTWPSYLLLQFRVADHLAEPLVPKALFSSEEVSAQNQVKASVQRRIRQSIAEEYPGLELALDDLLPKKSPLVVAKCSNHLNLVLVNNVPLFFNIRDGPYMPTLRLLHQRIL